MGWYCLAWDPPLRSCLPSVSSESHSRASTREKNSSSSSSGIERPSPSCNQGRLQGRQIGASVNGPFHVYIMSPASMCPTWLCHQLMIGSTGLRTRSLGSLSWGWCGRLMVAGFTLVPECHQSEGDGEVMSQVSPSLVTSNTSHHDIPRSLTHTQVSCKFSSLCPRSTFSSCSPSPAALTSCNADPPPDLLAHLWCL